MRLLDRRSDRFGAVFGAGRGNGRSSAAMLAALRRSPDLAQALAQARDAHGLDRVHEELGAHVLARVVADRFDWTRDFAATMRLTDHDNVVNRLRGPDSHVLHISPTGHLRPGAMHLNLITRDHPTGTTVCGKEVGEGWVRSTWDSWANVARGRGRSLTHCSECAEAQDEFSDCRVTTVDNQMPLPYFEYKPLLELTRAYAVRRSLDALSDPSQTADKLLADVVGAHRQLVVGWAGRRLAEIGPSAVGLLDPGINPHRRADVAELLRDHPQLTDVSVLSEGDFTNALSGALNGAEETFRLVGRDRWKLFEAARTDALLSAYRARLR